MSFPLIGNARLRSAVEKILASGNLPHALLLEGDHGLGRHTLANFIANAVVCSGTDRPCGICRGCHLAAAGSHPDITAVTPDKGKKSILVDQIRALRQQAFIRPHMAQRRVFIIDPADAMNEQAQNALLKVLEDPPSGVVFLLIAQSRTGLLDTVVSRCTAITLSAPPLQEAAAHLAKRLQISEQEASGALTANDGNLGRALEQLSGQTDDRVTAAAKELLGLLLKGDEYEALRLMTKFEDKRADAQLLFTALREEIARLLRERYADRAAARLLERMYDQFLLYDGLMKTNINLSLLFSAAVCRTVQLRNTL